MTRSELAAEALAAWTIDELRSGETSLARQALPEMDLRTFFRVFAGAGAFPHTISLALVGYGEDALGLKKLAGKAGAKCFGSFGI